MLILKVESVGSYLHVGEEGKGCELSQPARAQFVRCVADDARVPVKTHCHYDIYRKEPSYPFMDDQY